MYKAIVGPHTLMKDLGKMSDLNVSLLTLYTTRCSNLTSLL